MIDNLNGALALKINPFPRAANLRVFSHGEVLVGVGMLGGVFVSIVKTRTTLRSIPPGSRQLSVLKALVQAGIATQGVVDAAHDLFQKREALQDAQRAVAYFTADCENLGVVLTSRQRTKLRKMVDRLR